MKQGSSTRRELDQRLAARDAAKAAVDLAAADQRIAELDLEWTVVRAPIAGRVDIGPPPEVGELVGQMEPTLLCTITDDSKVYATYPLDEATLQRLRREHRGKRPGEDGRPLYPVRIGLIDDAGYPYVGVISRVFLANYLALNFRDQVARIDGVGGTNILPAKDYAMRVWLDPDKLRVRGLAVQDVVRAIQTQNVQVAAGSIGRPPAPTDAAVELVVTTRGRLTQPEEFEAIIVRRGDDRSVVRVSDVGEVELGTRDYSTIAAFNGRPNAISSPSSSRART